LQIRSSSYAVRHSCRRLAKAAKSQWSLWKSRRIWKRRRLPARHNPRPDKVWTLTHQWTHIFCRHGETRKTYESTRYQRPLAQAVSPPARCVVCPREAAKDPAQRNVSKPFWPHCHRHQHRRLADGGTRWSQSVKYPRQYSAKIVENQLRRSELAGNFRTDVCRLVQNRLISKFLSLVFPFKNKKYEWECVWVSEWESV
jgi:hypothetical protein